MLFGPLLQTAYVTRDIERACAHLADRYGLRDFLRAGPNVVETDEGETMVLKLAHAWLGSTWIEVIEPIEGAVSLYSSGLPDEGSPLRVHHVGIRLPDLAAWDAAMKRAGELSLRLALSLTRNRVNKYVVFDTFAELGHHIEYLYIPDASQSMMADMPQNMPLYGTMLS